MNHGENKYHDTNFLRFLAIVLIFNSHLDLYYPMPHIGTGGSLGVSLFFMLSSFGLYFSEKNNPKTFSEYYKNRIIRIFPAVWVTLIFLYLPILALTNSIDGKDLLQILRYFFYPPFWFLQALMVYYVFGYFFFRKSHIKHLIFPTIVIVLAYVLTYGFVIDLSKFSIEESPIFFIFYFGVFIYGIFLAHKSHTIVYAGLQDFVAVGFFLTVIYFHKWLMLNGLYPEFQAIQNICMFPLLFFLVKVARSPFVTSLMETFIVSDIISWIGVTTLEIYIIHTTLERLKFHELFSFPLNAIIFVMCTLAICFIIKRIQKFIMRFSRILSPTLPPPLPG